VGLALGIFILPLLTAPTGPTVSEVAPFMDDAMYSAEFVRDLEGSDFLHWGEGRVSVGQNAISLLGELSPGPDYRLYLVPEFVQNEEEFLRVKDRSVQIGDIDSFGNFVIIVPGQVDVSNFNTVLIWCESFSEFITAARYQEESVSS
jgi:hypothetical protein